MSRRIYSAAVVAAALILLPGCGPLPELGLGAGGPQATPPTAVVPSPFQALEMEVHERVNRHRADRRLPLLEYDARVAEIARRHSEAMAAGRLPLGHDGFEARSAAVSAIHPVRAMAENVAYDSRNRVGEQVVAGWIASPGHRRNIQGEAYDLTGVGVARSSDGIYYFTQLFITRAR